MTTTPSTPSTEQTAGEIFDSVNRFDEIAIARAFGESIYTLKEQAFDFLRAMAFVHMRRGGMTDAEAGKAAFDLTTRGARDYFTPAEPDELDPEDPETNQGKDGTPSR